MCKRLLLLFLLGFSCLAAVLPEEWFLIKESELQNLEKTWKTFEAEKRSWLSQVQNLRLRAESLEAESASLNVQLLNQRERNQKLTLSFDEYEAAQSRIMSQKNTQLIQLEAENKGKGKTIVRLIIAVVVLGLSIIMFIAIKIIKTFRVI